MIIRKATIKDIEIIFDFVCQLEEQMFDFRSFENIFTRNINNPDCHYWLAIDNDLAVGYGSCHGQWLLHHCGKVGEIQEMFVAKGYRDKGIGKLLLDTIRQMAIDEGYTHIEVTSNNKRTEAHRFYESNGYTKSHFKFTDKTLWL
jgi:(aminoalkyl)phosphonate N-acetyltransferase